MNLSIAKGRKKPFKIKTVVFQKIGRVILWTLIIFLILRGIGTLFVSSETGEARGLIDSFVKERSYQERVEREAASFAEGFATEYFTYERGDDYEQRIRKYMTTQASIVSNNYGKVKALNVRSYGVDWFSSNQINVSVAVKLRYEKLHRIGEESSVELIEDTIYVLVPVMEKEGRYIIEDHPAVVPPPDKAEINPMYFTGSGLDSSVVAEVTEVLESFFRTYYSGTPNEISYYMHQNQRVKGLENRYKFKSLESVRAYEGSTKDEILVLVELLIQDAVSEINYKQGYHLTLIKENQRFYIKDFNVRTVNLNNLREEKENE